MGTDDAMTWAEEFCRIFNVSAHTDGDAVMTTDDQVGLMVGWFANAMQVAIDIDKTRRARIREGYLAAGEPVPEAFIDGFEEGREV